MSLSIQFVRRPFQCVCAMILFSVYVQCLDVENWETLAVDRGRWRINCSACLDEGELRIRKEAMARRERRKAALNAPPASVFVCSGCSRVCSSRIGLFSHQSRCRNMR